MLTHFIRSQTQLALVKILNNVFTRTKSVKHASSNSNPEFYGNSLISKFNLNPNDLNEEQLQDQPEIENKCLRKQMKVIKELSLIGIDQIQVHRFKRQVPVFDRIENSKKLCEPIASFFDEKQQAMLRQMVREYLENTESLFSQKSEKIEKGLFKKLKNLLFQVFKNTEIVEEFLNNFSESDPNFIEFQEIRKLSQFHHFQPENIQPFKYMLTNIPGENQFATDKIQKAVQNKKYLALKYSIPTRVLQNKSMAQDKFKIDEVKMGYIGTGFSGKKIIQKEYIIIQKVRKEKKNDVDLSKNWVYAYDLPYDLTEELVEEIIAKISHKYGQITQFSYQPYKKVFERKQTKMVYSIPDNFQQQNPKNKIHLQKIQLEKGENENKSKKKTMTTKILSKIQDKKGLKFNKSSMVFQFKNHEDKVRFLSPQMRLFGLNIGKIQNVKFQEAQAKNIVALNMLKWGCQSKDLIAFCNDNLIPLNITLEGENCLIMRGLALLEFDNFVQAYSVKKILNNLQFQGQKLKARLNYGPCCVHEGEFKTNLELNHYNSLVKKLSEIQCFYNDVYK